MNKRDRTRARRGEPAGTVFLRLGLVLILTVVVAGCRAPRGRRDGGGGVPTAAPVFPSPITGQSSATPQPSTPASTAPTASPTTPSVVTGTPTPGEPEFGFGTFLVVPVDRVFAGNEEEFRTELRRIKELGINIVGQLFAPETTEADWRAFLDVAAEEGMLVTSAFDEAPQWNGSSFDLGIGGEFLEAMKDHPALYSHFLVDEPFHRKHNWEITTRRLQMLYQQAKSIAPDVLMHIGFSREIWKGEEGEYGADFLFRGKLCDICVISTLEFRNFGQGNRFDRETADANHLASRQIIRREDPQAQIWTTLQVFGSAATTRGDEGSTYYMPSPEELQQMVDLLLSPELQSAGALDGIMWQQWASRYSDQDRSQFTLSDPEFEGLRNIVKDTARRVGLLP